MDNRYVVIQKKIVLRDKALLTFLARQRDQSMSIRIRMTNQGPERDRS